MTRCNSCDPVLSKVVRPRRILLISQVFSPYHSQQLHHLANMQTASNMGRQSLPEPAEDEPSLNLWTLVKDFIGKARQNEGRHGG